MGIYAEAARAVLSDWLADSAPTHRDVAELPQGAIDRFFLSDFLPADGPIQAAILLDHGNLVSLKEMCDFLQRAAARCEVSVVLLAPHAVVAYMSFAQELADAFASSGATCRTVDAGPSIAASSPLARSAAFMLSHDGLAIEARAEDRTRSPSWIVSDRPEDVAHSANRFAALASQPAIDVARTPQISLTHALAEPMMRTAPLAAEASRALCSGNQVDGSDCGWYHGIWQYLRILNVVSTPTWHSDWYFETFRDLLGADSSQRVLVSGAADYSLLAHLAWVSRSQSPPMQIDTTILDLCETPLLLCRWYASVFDLSINTTQSDIRTARGAFNLIVADAFLTRFHQTERSQVLAAWCGLLREDGAIVTTVRVEERNDNAGISGTDIQVRQFSERVSERAGRLAMLLDQDPDHLAKKSAVYARNMTSFAYRSLDQLRAELEGAGLGVTKAEVVDVAGELVPSQYVRLVARKV